MFVFKDFVPDYFVAQICANSGAHAHILAHICATKQSRTKSFSTKHWNYSKEHAYHANFELKRLKPKLDIVEKPENRVHKLTDSNGAAPVHCDARCASIELVLFTLHRAARACSVSDAEEAVANHATLGGKTLLHCTSSLPCTAAHDRATMLPDKREIKKIEA